MSLGFAELFQEQLLWEPHLLVVALLLRNHVVFMLSFVVSFWMHIQIQMQETLAFLALCYRCSTRLQTWTFPLQTMTQRFSGLSIDENWLIIMTYKAVLWLLIIAWRLLWILEGQRRTWYPFIMMHAKWYYFESLAQIKPETGFNIAQLNFLRLNLPWGLPNYRSMKKMMDKECWTALFQYL